MYEIDYNRYNNNTNNNNNNNSNSSTNVIRKYKIGRMLGRGGFAKCFKVTDEYGNVYALKAVNRILLEKPKTLQKLHS